MKCFQISSEVRKTKLLDDYIARKRAGIESGSNCKKNNVDQGRISKITKRGKSRHREGSALFEPYFLDGKVVPIS